MALLPTTTANSDGLALPPADAQSSRFRCLLYSCTGKAAGTLVRTLSRFFDLSQSGCSWKYRKWGGCGAFTLELSGAFDVLDAWKTNEWEIDIIDIQTTPQTLYFRGVLENVEITDSGKVIATGQGYSADLQKIRLSNVNCTGMTVAEVVKSLLDTYVVPETRITYVGGDLFGTYTVNNVTFNGSVFDAFKTLAELQGMTDWGVRADRSFYFLHEVIVPTAATTFVVQGDLSDVTEGFSGTKQTNGVYVTGGMNSGALISGSATNGTSQTNLGKREVDYCKPELLHITDADQWCTNMLNQYVAGCNYYTASVSMMDVDNNPRRLEASIPIPPITLIGNTGTSITGSLYEVEYQFKEGCAFSLTADITIGYPPENLVQSVSQTSAKMQSLAITQVRTLAGNWTTATDIEITDTIKGLILRSPNGTRWRITVDNAGVLVTGVV